MGNKALAKAKDIKNDEFYTQLSDIEKELKHYRKHFKNKIVFCNCDDPEYSNFWKYFYLNYEQLGLKKLVATHYETEKPSYKLEYDGEKVIKTKLSQNGDFRSPECVEIMENSDIICTNPPFSLIKEYIPLIQEKKKDLLILAPQNALHYKEIFPLIQDNKMWIGYTAPKEFKKPDGSVKKFGNIMWVTNLDIDKRHENIILYKKYDEEYYPKYENLDAIEVNKISEIPEDYDGMIGVPDNFLSSYNPEQFEIVGYGRGDFLPIIDFVPQEFLDVYRKQGGRGHITAGMKSLCFYNNEGDAKFPYSRIIIKRRK